MTEPFDHLYYKPLVAVVSEAEHGKTVRDVLQKKLGVSRKLLSSVKLTEHGLTVNEERVYTSAKVSAGDMIRVRMEREESEDILPQNIPLQIVYEDEDLLIVNKPAGMIVHPTHGHYTNTMANGVVYHWQQRGEKVRFRPVHRLDEETSGLVAIAKTAYVHQQLSEQLQADEILKVYRAYVYGCPEPEAGTVNAPIDRDPEEPHVRIVTPEGEGYPSVTHYETVKRFVSSQEASMTATMEALEQALNAPLDADKSKPCAAVVRLRLETGRTHQIRVHMKHIGCPLIGDKMYGPKEGVVEAWEEAVGRQSLHAETLGLTHPITREYMEWNAPLPAELLQLEEKLEGE